MIEKLAGIRRDLVRNNHDWQNWDFVKLCDALVPGFVETQRNQVKIIEMKRYNRNVIKQLGELMQCNKHVCACSARTPRTEVLSVIT